MSVAPPARLRIDVATGEVGLDAVDAVIPGPIPLVLRRAYRSFRTAGGAFGPGWTWTLDVALTVDAEAVRCVGGAFDGAAFGAIGPGRAARQEDTGLVLEHHPDAYVLWASPRRRLVFDKRGAVGETIPLSAVRDGSGGSLTLDRRGGRVVRVAGAPSGPLHLEYGSDGIEAVVQGRQSDVLARWNYTGGALRSAAGPGRRLEHFAYASGRLVEHRADGATTFAQYDAEGRGLAIWGTSGAGVRVGYDARRHTTRVLDGAGSQTLYRHTPDRQVLEQIRPDASARVFYYGLDGRLAGYGEADGPLIFQAFDPSEASLLVVDHGLRAAAIAYDADGRAVTVGLIEDEAPFTLAWSDAHTLAAIRTPEGHVWRIERDRAGRVESVVSPAGRTARLSWSPQGLAVEDAEGKRREETWDGAGRLVSRVDRSGRRERRRYGDDAHLAAVEVGRDYRIEAFRDAAGRLTAVSDSDGDRIKIDRDGAGRIVRIAGPGDRQVAVSHDAQGRLARVDRQDGAHLEIAYLADGRIAAVEGPDGTASYAVDDGETVVTDPTGERRYNRAGDLRVQIAGEQRTAFAYGAHGELLLWEGWLGDAHLGAVRFGYGAEGRLTQIDGRPPHADASVALRLAADADGWPTAILSGGTPVVDVETDALGRPARLGGHLDARMGFDAADRLVRVETEAGPLDIAYDAIDRPTHLRRGDRTADLVASPTETWDEVLATGEGLDGQPLALRVHVARHGVAVSVDVGPVPIVVWARAEVRCPPASQAARQVAAVLRGLAAALPARSASPDAGLDAWAPDPHRDVRIDQAAVPRAADLGLPWPVLDAFFLDPDYLDAIPGGLAESRTPDGSPEGITGMHTHHALRAAPWRSRGRRAVCPTPDLLALDGPPSLGDVLAHLDA
ncbi:DUF6531 domain-containing protein [Rubrivirga sp. IMCC43871]|uniref:DUF6531 domain-containing protein n=1 Tax=Rubrivirga sp. IMCC43871 TaxID=3391575 RepID=UPI00398F8F57